MLSRAASAPSSAGRSRSSPARWAATSIAPRRPSRTPTPSPRALAARRRADHAGRVDPLHRQEPGDRPAAPRAHAARRSRRCWRASSRTAVAELPTEEDAIPDERLELIFACCHPALAADAQVPLTLRLVGGLTVPEIARALLLEEATVQQRIVRAKRKVRTSGIPLAVPDAEQAARAPRRRARRPLPRLQRGLRGDDRPGARARGPRRGGDPPRRASSSRCCPRQPEPSGLLALMLLQHSRRAARTPPGDAGGIVLLADQDRALWDRRPDRRGARAARRARCPRDQRPGPYALQAAIAAEHARGERARRTPTGAGSTWLYKALAARAADARRRAQPRRRGGDGRRPGRPASSSSTGSRRRRARRLPPAARHPRRPAAPPRPSPARPPTPTGARSRWPPTSAERRFLAGRLAECETPG